MTPKEIIAALEVIQQMVDADFRLEAHNLIENLKAKLSEKIT